MGVMSLQAGDVTPGGGCGLYPLGKRRMLGIREHLPSLLLEILYYSPTPEHHDHL